MEFFGFLFSAQKKEEESIHAAMAIISFFSI
jgi:hypothetical protein